MNKSDTAPAEVHHSHWADYPKFIWRMLVMATEGNWLFYAWMIFLTAVSLVGLNAWSVQVSEGMGVTNMTDHVSWGLYIANFTFMVGLAAGGVMMVIPAYLYHDEDMHDVVIIGELLAIAAIFMCIGFVVVDLGRPDRFWHMIPGIGKFHFPISMLTWDVIVLNGYLLINLHICGYLLYNRYRGVAPNPKWYIPFVFLSIAWAISIHTVTAFLYQGLGGRPFWNTALLAPRFLTSAFVSGPAFIILALEVIRYLSKYKVGDGAIKILVNIMRVTILINLVMLVSEVFTEFYTGSSHAASAKYLYFGLHGYNALVPWIWTSVALTIVAALLLLCPKVTQKPVMLITACLLAFVGIWIEKGMGLIIPGFIPNTLHEIVEYLPNGVEWRISAGVWAAGLMIYTLAIRIAMPIFSGEVSLEKDTNA